MAHVKEISIGYPRQRKELKVTFPGGIVNITTGVENRNGQKVVHISVSANGDRFAGEPQWWVKWGKVDETGAGCRIIQGTRMDVRREA